MPISQSTPGLLTSPELIEQVTDWMHHAGQLAMTFFMNCQVSYKSDQTLLTQADLEVEHFLAEKVGEVFPDHYLIGEEDSSNKQNSFSHCELQSDVASSPDATSAQQKNVKSPYTWIIDPIDGTTAFAQGLPGWGISIGLLYQGLPCLGFFHMPLVDDLTYVTSLGDVYWNHQPFAQGVLQSWTPKSFLAITAAAHDDFDIDIRHTRALGSIGANLVYTARGTAGATLIPKARIWDLVAGAAILHGAGGELRYLDGTSIDYGELLDGRLAPMPILGGHSQVLDELQTMIRPRHKNQ